MIPQIYNHLTPKQRKELRLKYIAHQDFLCAHCKESLQDSPPPKIMSQDIDWKYFPPGFLNNPVHLHHDHATGLTIGAVHARCNAVLWQIHGK